MGSRKKNFYCVKNGFKKGIYRTWPECQAQCLGFKGAKFRGFPTLEEAKEWLGPEVMAEEGFVMIDDAAAAQQAPVREEIDPVTGEKRKIRQYVKGGKKNKKEKPDGVSDEAWYASAAAAASSKKASTAIVTGFKVNKDLHRLEVVIHFDGGSRGNTGEIAGAGARIVMTEFTAPQEEGADASTVKDEEGKNATTGEEAIQAAPKAEGDGAKNKKLVHRTTTLIEMRDFLTDDPEEIKTNTNNVAEYSGLILGLKELQAQLMVFASDKKAITAPEQRPQVYISIFGDSLLVINQMKGSYKCKSENLKPFYTRAKTLEEKLKTLEDDAMTIHIAHMEFEHCYRAHNEEADRLANEAMDARTSWKTVHVEREVDGVDEAAGSEWV